MSKKRSPGDGSGSSGESARTGPLASGSGGSGSIELEQDLTGRIAGQLDPAWFRILSSADWPIACDRRTWRRSSRGRAASARRASTRWPRWARRDPGDEREVVVRPPLVRADAVPAADPAVLDRLRVGDRRLGVLPKTRASKPALIER